MEKTRKFPIKFVIISLTLYIIYLSGYAGYKIGTIKNTDKFQKDLIDRGLAEYNNKTGVWQYRSMSDIVESQPSLFDLPKKSILDTPNIVNPEVPKKKIVKRS